eukprot:gene10049-2221_t
MPSFPCDECKEVFANTVQLKRHKLSNQCAGHLKVLEENRKRENLPLYEFEIFKDGKPAPLNVRLLHHPGIEGAHHSAGGLGSLGVYFMNLKGNHGVVVFKEGTQSTPADVFCSKLLHTMGIATPAIDVLSKQSHTSLIKILVDTPFTVRGAGDHLQDARAQNAGGVIMEFVPGVTLKHPDVQACLSKDTVLKDLGRIIAADMLLNNFDRTPYIWDHQGNANNILFVPQNNFVYAIDNTTASIIDEDGQQAYCERVKDAVQDASNRIDNSNIKAVSTFLEKWGQTSLSDDQRLVLQDAITEACTKISHHVDIMSAWQETSQIFSRETSISNANLEEVNISFLLRVKEAIATGLNK